MAPVGARDQFSPTVARVLVGSPLVTAPVDVIVVWPDAGSQSRSPLATAVYAVVEVDAYEYWKRYGLSVILKFIATQVGSVQSAASGAQVRPACEQHAVPGVRPTVPCGNDWSCL